MRTYVIGRLLQAVVALLGVTCVAFLLVSLSGDPAFILLTPLFVALGLVTDGLYALGARYHDPALGRFTSQDPAGQGNNPYAYAADDPVNNADPTGTSIWSDGAEFIDDVFTADAYIDYSAMGGSSGDLATTGLKSALGRTSSTTPEKRFENSSRLTSTRPRTGSWMIAALSVIDFRTTK